MKLVINYSLATLASLVLLGPWASGQEIPTNTDGKKQFQRVTLLPVGDLAVGGAKVVNGAPVPVNPKPSELVPNPLFVKEDKEYKALSLRMNSPSNSWRLPSGGLLNVLTQKDGQYANYAAIKLPDGKEDVTVFMLRNKQSKSWTDSPETLVFKNGIESFPLGSARLINFSRVPIMAGIGKQKILIPPHDFRVVNDPGSDGKNIFFPYQIVSKINNQEYKVASSAVSYDKQSRINFLFYERDGNSEIKMEGDERPLKFVQYFELAYKAPDDESTVHAAAP